MFNLTINSTNVANSLNNMYQYQFKNGAFEVPANTNDDYIFSNSIQLVQHNN